MFPARRLVGVLFEDEDTMLAWVMTWPMPLDDTPGRWAASAHRGLGIAYAALDRPRDAVAAYRAYLELPNAPDRADVERWVAALG